MKLRNFNLIIGGCIICLVILACTINIGGPAYPTRAIPVSTEAIGELQATVDAAIASSGNSGQVTLEISETQLTSYLAYWLSTQSQPILVNPQAYLQNGQIQLYGTAVQGNFEATAKIVMMAGVDQQGQLLLDITSADFGPLPVPTGLLDAITGAIKEAYTGALGPVATGFRLTTISVADGTMTIAGQVK
jgi:hypothetical protein